LTGYSRSFSFSFEKIKKNSFVYILSNLLLSCRIRIQTWGESEAYVKHVNRSNEPPDTSEEVGDHSRARHQSENSRSHGRVRSKLEAMAPLEPHGVHSEHSRHAYEPRKSVMGGSIHRQNEVKGNEGDQVPQQAMGSVVQAYLCEIVDEGTVWKVEGPEESGEDVQKLNQLHVLQCTHVTVSCALSAAMFSKWSMVSRAERRNRAEIFPYTSDKQHTG
jgi:hypothetical protein